MRNSLLFFLFSASMYFTLSLCFCTVEFTGYTADGKKLIDYEFASKHVEWGPKEVFVKTLKEGKETEKNVECETYGYCCGYDGCGYGHDCDGHRAFVTYEWKVNVYRKELKLEGGRVIKGIEYEREDEKVIAKAKCIQD